MNDCTGGGVGGRLTCRPPARRPWSRRLVAWELLVGAGVLGALCGAAGGPGAGGWMRPPRGLTLPGPLGPPLTPLPAAALPGAADCRPWHRPPPAHPSRTSSLRMEAPVFCTTTGWHVRPPGAPPTVVTISRGSPGAALRPPGALVVRSCRGVVSYTRAHYMLHNGKAKKRTPNFPPPRRAQPTLRPAFGANR